MTSDEINRRMELFEKQQEAFASDMMELGFKLKDIAERQDRLQERQDRFQEQQEKQQSRIDVMLQAITGLTALIGDSHIRQKEADQRMAELTEAQKQTDVKMKELAERLDAFIIVVERYISENRNGKH
ncbi:MAG: hypothetical protein U0Z53_25020 [Blastocatellia bacterium]